MADDASIIRFTHRGAQVVIDLSCFTNFPEIGYKQSLVLANKVYVRCLQLYPEMESDRSKIRGELYMEYKESGSVGASKRQSAEHFETSVLHQHALYNQLNEALEKVRRLVKEGIPTTLSPNARAWASANDSGQSNTARNTRDSGPPRDMMRPTASPPPPSQPPQLPLVTAPPAAPVGGGR